jgi:hypothetical protein
MRNKKQIFSSHNRPLIKYNKSTLGLFLENGVVMFLNIFSELLGDLRLLQRALHIIPPRRTFTRVGSLSMVLLSLAPFHAFAADMKECIQIETEPDPIRSEPRKVMVNNCGSRVYVFWCHVEGGRYPCKGDKHFRQGRYLEEGQRFTNSVTLPSSISIDYGACSGDRTRVKFGANGSYECPVEAMKMAGKRRQHSLIRCDDGRTVGFDWDLEGKTEKSAAIMLKDGSVRIPLDEFLAFEKDSLGNPPGVLRKQVCQTTAPSGDLMPIGDLRDSLRKRAEKIENEARQRCAAIKNIGDECMRFRGSPNSVSGPPRG